MILEAKGFGATIAEAKEKAIADLNAAEDADIQFEVIATPKKKTLGLFGGRQAEVRVFVELPDEKPQRKKAQPKKEEKPKKVEKTAAVKEEAAPKKSVSKYGEPVNADEISADTKAGKAVAYLKEILKQLGCTEVTMKVAERENAALIELNGEGLGVVIGHRGETLDSIQYLTGLVASNGGGYYKITLNIGDYREKREQALTNLAKRVAEQVLRTGKCRTLEPMNPYERRIIHTAVQSIDGVVSGSFGEGSGRRVVIGIEGKELKPARREQGRRDGYSRRPRAVSKTVSSEPLREPKKDNDAPLYGKIN